MSHENVTSEAPDWFRVQGLVRERRSAFADDDSNAELAGLRSWSGGRCAPWVAGTSSRQVSRGKPANVCSLDSLVGWALSVAEGFRFARPQPMTVGPARDVPKAIGRFLY